MNNKNDIFQCDICGNLVSVISRGKGTLKCCGEKMIHLKPQTGDPASEKHIPYLTETDLEVQARVGKHPHPMVKAHYIGFIQASDGDTEVRQFFGPGQDPVLNFLKTGKKIKVSSYCLLHGVFESDDFVTK
ncbi:MAG: desulfoferrodoxin FeS4 iron-binding domain-containing protein [Desulfobacteraceae bacterium]|nr:desulfoferrodoxin FeS4 iron-binding domain-containing protein [Desulfobacteraceae bacterium]